MDIDEKEECHPTKNLPQNALAHHSLIGKNLVQKLIFDFHNSFPKRRVQRFTFYLGQRTRMEIFILNKLLPNTLFG
jgi:hypothetical protein